MGGNHCGARLVGFLFIIFYSCCIVFVEQTLEWAVIMKNKRIALEIIKIAKSLVADENDNAKIMDWCKNANKEGEKLKSFVFYPNIYLSTFGRKKVCFEVHIGYSKGVWGREIANQDTGLKKIVDFLNRKVEECKKLFPNAEIEW